MELVLSAFSRVARSHTSNARLLWDLFIGFEELRTARDEHSFKLSIAISNSLSIVSYSIVLINEFRF